MEDQTEGLVDRLVRVARFATAWLRGRDPAPLEEWQLHALPGAYSRAVLDDAGHQVPLDGARYVEAQGVNLWLFPPPDTSGVAPGVWYQWTNAWEAIRRRRSRPGGRYPVSTDLRATVCADSRMSLLFTMGPPSTSGVQAWVGTSRGWDTAASPFGPDGRPGPSFRRAPSIIPEVDHFVADRAAPAEIDRLSRPGAHRARQWQQVRGGQVWGGIVVSARGYPDLRVLQVALHEGWISREEAYPALQEALRQTHFWPWSPEGREVVAANEEDDLIGAATDTLIEQALQGDHTPAYPLGKQYLRRLARRDLAVLPDRSGSRGSSAQDEEGDEANEGLEDGQPPRHRGLPRPATTRLLDGTIDDEPAPSPWNPRHLRRVTTGLAHAAGYPSLTLLTPEQRQVFEEQAIEELRRRQRLRDLRQWIGERLAEGGATISSRAVQQFVARHRSESPAEFRRSVGSYLAQTKRRPAR